MLNARPVALAFRFRKTNGNHLRAVIPLVNRGGNVQSLVTLQSDQTASKGLGQHFRDFSLANTCLPLDEQWPAHSQCQIKHRRQRAIGDVVGLGQ